MAHFFNKELEPKLYQLRTMVKKSFEQNKIETNTKQNFHKAIWNKKETKQEKQEKFFEHQKNR